jgi:hypothetical protein
MRKVSLLAVAIMSLTIGCGTSASFAGKLQTGGGVPPPCPARQRRWRLLSWLSLAARRLDLCSPLVGGPKS